jgi:hypothetical protein
MSNNWLAMLIVLTWLFIGIWLIAATNSIKDEIHTALRCDNIHGVMICIEE